MKEVIKRFLEWIKLKEKLHNYTHRSPIFKDGEVWWCSIGENVGHEINGKSAQFSRPVLVFKKLSPGTFLGIPMSTQTKEGTWYVKLYFQNIPQVVILNQARTLDYKRLYNKIGRLHSADFKKVKVGFRRLYLE